MNLQPNVSSGIPDIPQLYHNLENGNRYTNIYNGSRQSRTWDFEYRRLFSRPWTSL